MTEEYRRVDDAKTSDETPAASGAAAAEVRNFAVPARAELMVSAGQSKFEQIVAVRRALYQALPVAMGDKILDPDPKKSYRELAEDLKGGDVAVWCAGSALIYLRALEELGFKGWIFHFGFTDDLTHAVTLVDVDGVIVVQDVYLNEGVNADIRQILVALERGEGPPTHHETRDRKVHVIHEDYDDKIDLEWYERSAQYELPPLGAYRRFVLGPHVHRDRVTKSWTGRNARRLAKVGLPRDNAFLMLNPIGIYDGVDFFPEPSAMPVIKEWIEGGGVTLARRIGEVEERTDPLLRNIKALNEKLGSITAERERAIAEARSARAFALFAARQQRQHEKLASERDTMAEMAKSLRADVATMANAIRQLEDNQAALEAKLTEATRAEAALREENKELTQAALLSAAELNRLLPEPERRPSPQSPSDAAHRALAYARRIAGLFLEQSTREKVLANETRCLQREQAALHQEVLQLSGIINKSRYLRFRRRLARWLKRTA